MARVHVREIKTSSNLEEEWKKTRSLPRVIKASKKEGGHWIVTPENTALQTMVSHISVGKLGRDPSVPGGHGHQNEAVFYILEGKGYEIHDGKRYDWEAGDIVVVHADSVHRHFTVGDKPSRALVIKTKPQYIFMNLIAQKKHGKGHEGEEYD